MTWKYGCTGTNVVLAANIDTHKTPFKMYRTIQTHKQNKPCFFIS